MAAKQPARRTRETKKRVDGKPDQRSTGLSREQRAERNAFILQCFIAGRSERWIAAHPKVQLTPPTVHNIIADQLQAAAKRQGLLTEHALTIYTERLETLIGRAWPKVLDGDLKAIEVGRRLLEQQARLYDLAEERGPMVNITPPMSDDELSMIDEDSPAYQQLDDLTKYRLKQHREAQGY